MVARSARKSTFALTSIKILLFIAAVAAGGYLGMRTLADVGRQSAPKQTQPASPPAASRRADTSDTRSVKIYIVKIADDEPYLAPVTYLIPSDVDPKTAAIKKLLEVGKSGGDSAGLIPPGTRLLSLHVDRGLATLDLSWEFVNNFSGGSMQESLTLGAIVRTLTQFRDVDRVQILVGGRAVDSLGGHFGLSEPLKPGSVEIQPGASE